MFFKSCIKIMYFFYLIRRMKEPATGWKILAGHVTEAPPYKGTMSVKKIEKVHVKVKVKKKVKKDAGGRVNKVK